MKRMWCDLCGEPITEKSYTKVETSIRDCNSEDAYYEYLEGAYYPAGPFEVHRQCFLEAFADFQKKKKLPEGTTHE